MRCCIILNFFIISLFKWSIYPNIYFFLILFILFIISIYSDIIDNVIWSADVVFYWINIIYMLNIITSFNNPLIINALIYYIWFFILLGLYYLIYRKVKIKNIIKNKDNILNYIVNHNLVWDDLYWLDLEKIPKTKRNKNIVNEKDIILILNKFNKGFPLIPFLIILNIINIIVLMSIKLF